MRIRTQTRIQDVKIDQKENFVKYRYKVYMKLSEIFASWIRIPGDFPQCESGSTSLPKYILYCSTSTCGKHYDWGYFLINQNPEIRGLTLPPPPMMVRGSFLTNQNPERRSLTVSHHDGERLLSDKPEFWEKRPQSLPLWWWEAPFWQTRILR